VTIQFINKRRKVIPRMMILNELKRIKPRKVLDNGCGKYGSWDYNKTPELEIEKTDIIYGQDSQNLPFKDKSFDCVVFAGVVQYVADPAKALRECSRVLKEGGMLIIFTINANSLINNITGFKAENTAFTPKGFREMLLGGGFKTIKEEMVDFGIIPRNRRMIIYSVCRKIK